MSVFKVWIFSGSFFTSDQSLPSPYTVLATLKQFTLNISCTAGVSTSSKSPQEGVWVVFQHIKQPGRGRSMVLQQLKKSICAGQQVTAPCWFLNAAGAKNCCCIGRGDTTDLGKDGMVRQLYTTAAWCSQLCYSFFRSKWAHTLCSLSTDRLSSLSNRGTRRAETRLSHPPLTQFPAVLTWATAGLRDINKNGAAELELLPLRQNLVFWSALFALWHPVDILGLVYYYYSQFSLLL